MVTRTKGASIVWQTEYDSGQEQPIVIAKYHGSITIEQNGGTVHIMDEYVEEFIKTLRKVAKEEF